MLLMGVSGPGYSAEYQAVLDYGTAHSYTLPVTMRAKDNRHMVEIKNAGILALLDFYYVYLTDGGKNFSCINWINPNNFLCLQVSSPSFAAMAGFTGDGVAAYLDSQLNPVTSPGIHYSQNNSCIGGFEIGNLAANNSPLVGQAGSSTAFINSRNASNQAGGRINDTSSLSVASLDSSGWWAVERTGAAARQFYKNGASIGSDVQASTALNSSTLTGLKFGSGLSARTIGCFFGGAALGPALMSTFYNSFLTRIS